MEITPAYRLLLSDAIPEIGGKGTLLRHVKSGAHLFLIETEDTNKVFSIAFRTTPEDDTGAAHIMEHSVLCGSEKYPLKDPFMELAKGSMNTFLNAMTYPDKTLYPVASVNDRDFRNLMDVYLDAVFHPNIYREEKIFRQEGWHYELTDPEGPLTYNGVVYNEMRGAFSNPETVLERKLLHALFPHNCYANESGGDPGAIPDLTYEAFCAFHRRYYHPSNAYIYLYGKMDMGERLAYLDREYLSHYDAIDPGTEIPDEPPFCGMVREEGVYASEGEPAGVMLAYAKVVNGGLDPVESMAFDALSYALINAPGAPLTQALLDAGLAEDVYGGYDSGLKQPVFRVIAKGAKEGDEEAFEALIERVLAEQAEQGVSEESLRAGIHNNEFSLREADYGRMPKGLIYGLGVYDTWLNDEYAPMLNLKFEAPLAEVKARVGTGYFETLIREKLLLNPHGAMVSVRPEEGLAEQEDRRTAEKLEGVRASMTPEERARLVRETEALKAYQAEPSPKEDLEKIPLLSIGDLEPGTRPFVNRETALAGLKTFWHPAVTSGILYLDMYFGIDHVEAADLPYLTVLKNVLSLIGTEHYTYQALANAISLRTGGIGCSVEMFAVTDSDALREDFVIRAKCLYGETADMADLVAEIAFRTDFSDTKRLKELLSELRLDMKDSIVESGHATAVARVLARCTKDAYENECLKGIEFYRFLTDLLDHYEERKDALVSKLR
ncbi:MAG: insulinase family protein, partial [Lachnospiraceae bacterium]|nr:insulinase family protein [Lachnospiraceae bacterium]